MRLITINEADSAAITAVPAAVATMPATFLQEPSRKRMRCMTISNQVLQLVWPSTRIFSAMALLRHNLSGAATWRVQIWADAAATTLVWDSGAGPACPGKALGDLFWGIDPLGSSVFTGWAYAFSVLWFTPVAGQAMTITLDDPTNSDGFLAASRLFAGNYLETADGPSMGMKLKWSEGSKQRRSDGGTLRTDATESWRVLSFSLDWLSKSDRPKFLEVGRRVGKRKDIFVSVYPGEGGALERDYTMQGKFVSDLDITLASPIRYALPIQIEEA